MIPSSITRFEYTLTTADQILPYPNIFLANSHILVVRDDGDNLTPLVEASDYSVSGATLPDGGFVTMIPGGANNVQVGDVIVLTRNMPFTQITSWVENGTTFGAFTTEDGIDRCVMMSQQLLDMITHSYATGIPIGFVQRRIKYCLLDGSEQTSTFLVRD